MVNGIAPLTSGVAAPRRNNMDKPVVRFGNDERPTFHGPVVEIVNRAYDDRNASGERVNSLDLMQKMFEAARDFAHARIRGFEATHDRHKARIVYWQAISQFLNRRFEVGFEDYPAIIQGLQSRSRQHQNLDGAYSRLLWRFSDSHQGNIPDWQINTAYRKKQPNDDVNQYVWDFLDMIFETPLDGSVRTDAVIEQIVREVRGIPEAQVEAASEAPTEEVTSREVVPATQAEEDPKQFETLNTYSRDLLKAVREGRLPRVYQRNDAVNRVLTALNMDSSRPNVLVSSPSGAGKTFISYGLAHAIVNGEVPREYRKIKNARVFDLNIDKLTACDRENFEKRLQSIIGEIDGYLSADPGRKVVLVADEAHKLKYFGMLEILKTSLFEKYGDQLSILANSTPKDIKRHGLDSDQTFQRRFQTVPLEAMDERQVESVVGEEALRLGDAQGIEVPPDSLAKVLKLSKTELASKPRLQAAIDVLGMAVSVAQGLPTEVYPLLDKVQRAKSRRGYLNHALESEAGKKTAQKALYLKELQHIEGELRENEQKLEELQALQAERRAALRSGARIELTPQHVSDAVSILTGNPFINLGENQIDNILNARKILAKRVVGQPEALEMAEQALFNIVDANGEERTEDQKGPLTSMLFVGPTGVGKTELAKAIADKFFNGQLIPLDMGEYKESHSVSRLIGAPPGYVGFDTATTLCERVRENPYSVILFDEIEKAHPDVRAQILQILEEGRLTDGNGVSVDFSKTMIIMTSNLQEEELRKMMAEHRASKPPLPISEDDELEQKVRESLIKGGFDKAELGRVEYIVPFNALKPEHLKEILAVMVDRLNDTREFQRRDLKVELTAKASERLIERASQHTEDLFRRPPGFNAPEPPKILQSGARDLRTLFKKTVRQRIKKYMMQNRGRADLMDGKLVVDYKPQTGQWDINLEKMTTAIAVYKGFDGKGDGKGRPRSDGKSFVA